MAEGLNFPGIANAIVHRSNFPTRWHRQSRAIAIAPEHDRAFWQCVLRFRRSQRGNDTDTTFDAKAAERFAKLALACVHKEYPNKIAHVLNSDADVAPPRKLTPAFCGCYDWHSSVHGHWLLVRLLRTFPNAPFAKDARAALKQSLTAENLKQEAAYIKGKAAPALSGLTDCRGCCNCAPNCANGTMIRRERMVGEPETAGRCSGRTTDELAAEAFHPGADRRARPNRVRPRFDVRLRALGEERFVCQAGPRFGQKVFPRGQELSAQLRTVR